MTLKISYDYFFIKKIELFKLSQLLFKKVIFLKMKTKTKTYDFIVDERLII